MTDRIRVLLSLARPAVVVLLALFAATGLAAAGHAEDRLLLARVLVAVAAFLLYAVVVNDLSDEAIDRVNLPDRPLAAGVCSRREFVIAAAVSAVVAVGAAASLGQAPLLVMAGGLALVSAYSLRPVRLADRGAVASLVLPGGYVAAPFLLGVLSARPSVHRSDLALLAGLYVGFIGRILLKDFRDVRGDALFGKRTFLVRHGRQATCAFSAACWAAGCAALAATGWGAFGAAEAVECLAALVLLRALSVDRGVRRDERLISAIAILGRAMVVTLFAHLSTAQAGWPRLAQAGFLASFTGVALAAATTMARRGPRPRLTVPVAWNDAGVVDEASAAAESDGQRRALVSPSAMAASSVT
jgi:4-hydroxybenzoate polyprenyltransferase